MLPSRTRRFIRARAALLTGVCLWGIALSSPLLAQSRDEEDVSLAFGNEEFLSIATGRKQPISKAPAVASVITAEDIKAIGAIDLSQVLETVPGLHVSVSSIGFNPIFTIRGIYSEYNPQVLVLINGIPATNLLFGNRGQAWGGMPVEDIARIEIIRGPGSAIYGADAFAGAINVITKTSGEIDGTEIGARGGSFDTGDAWLLHGGNIGGWQSAFYAEYLTTKGQDRTVEADAQSYFDNILGTSASLAPGPVNTGVDSLDARVDLSRQYWRIRFGYQGRRNGKVAIGIAQALDPAGNAESDRFNADITYHNPVFSRNWDVTSQLSFYDVSNRSDLVVFPPGADFTALGGGAFPDGVIGNPDVYERFWRLGASGFYTGIDKHNIRVGAGVNYGDLYKVKESKNYILNPIGIPVPLGSVTDVSSTAPFVRPESRTDWYSFAQDEWSFAPDWALTAGVRYDHYSDFGGTTNPRLALVWQTSYNLTTKLLYGRAFRAPSFAEQFNINNPVALGNPNLRPETIDTGEVAFDYQYNDRVRMGLNLFYYKMQDIIRFVPDAAPATTATAQNTGSQTGHGLEWEMKWDVTDKTRWLANYAYQRSRDDETDSDAGNAPHHQIYTRVDWRFQPNWALHTQLNRVMGRDRVSGDTRPTVPDFTTVDVTLRRKAIVQGLEAAVSVRNLFDADVREPSLAPGLIPNDLPLAGRWLYGELRYHW